MFSRSKHTNQQVLAVYGLGLGNRVYIPRVMSMKRVLRAPPNSNLNMIVYEEYPERDGAYSAGTTVPGMMKVYIPSDMTSVVPSVIENVDVNIENGNLNIENGPVSNDIFFIGNYVCKLVCLQKLVTATPNPLMGQTVVTFYAFIYYEQADFMPSQYVSAYYENGLYHAFIVSKFINEEDINISKLLGRDKSSIMYQSGFVEEDINKTNIKDNRILYIADESAQNTWCDSSSSVVSTLADFEFPRKNMMIYKLDIDKYSSYQRHVNLDRNMFNLIEETKTHNYRLSKLDITNGLLFVNIVCVIIFCLITMLSR